ncbi:hypothetical protein JCM10213_008601 [Rhodosporidiobolus nylandii]
MHPFADTTNRSSVFFAPAETAGKYFESEGRGLGLGMPFEQPPPRSHRHTQSTSSSELATPASPHARIPAPVYPVRSQRISQSHRSTLSLSGAIEAPLSPTISGGLARRQSLSSASEASEDDEPKKPIERPLARRSESLPSFPPPEVLDAREKEEKEREAREKRERELASLPPNPKLWLPSHLALHLTHTLSLPSPIAADIAAFIRTSRLSGRSFLRLRDEDFDELGINVRWRRALSEARDALRAELESQGRAMWGFGGGAEEPAAKQAVPTSARPTLKRRTSVEVEGSASEDEQVKEEWKRSWRALGSRTPGRVRGLRAAFESGAVDAVEELSEPSSSPAKSSRAGSLAVRAEAGDGKKRMSWAEGWAEYESGRAKEHTRGESTESALSEASVDSAGGKYDGSSSAAASLATLPPRHPSSSPLTVPGTGDDDLFAPSPVERRHPSPASSDQGLPFPFSTPTSPPPHSSFEQHRALAPSRSPSPSPSRLLPPDAPASPAVYQSAITSRTLPYALIRRPSSNGSPTTTRVPLSAVHTPPAEKGERGAQAARDGGRGGGALSKEDETGRVSVRAVAKAARAEGEEGDSADEVEEAVRTVRPSRSRSGTGGGDAADVLAPSSAAPAGGLAELFGLDVPKQRRTGGGGKQVEGEEELATLFVPDRGGTQGRKGSLVVVKKSQLAALHRRMDEVESLVSSLAPASVPTSPVLDGSVADPDDGVRRYYDATYRGRPEEQCLDEVELDEDVERIESLENRVRQLTTTSTSTSAPLPFSSSSTAEDAARSPSSSPRSSFLRSSTLTAHTLDTSLSFTDAPTSPKTRSRSRQTTGQRRDEEADEEPEERRLWPEGWKELSGYVLAASFGIGIVAGEVVLSQLFGMRGRR